MLSMIPSGSTQFLYHHPAAPQAVALVQPNHHHHQAAAAAAAEHAVHFRSASMPESVYIHRVQQRQQQQQQVSAAVGASQQPQYFKPVPAQAHQSVPRRPQAGSGLRRSATNVADFQRRLTALQPAGAGPRGAQVHPWGSQVDLGVARSRTNIMQMQLGPGGGGPTASGATGGPKRSQVTRASSFYHPSNPSSFSARTSSLTRPQKDLSKPLHVDCSIEYDLGAQPKIPKDSAPLLIIHPDYTKRKQQQQQLADRFHPYVGLPAGQPAQRTPQNASRPMAPAARTAPNNKVSRHQSFMVQSSSYHPTSALTHHVHPVNGRGSNNLMTSFAASDLNLHLSMPDISMDDEDDEELIRYHQIATMRQQRKAAAATTGKKQHVSRTSHHQPNQPVRRGVSMAARPTHHQQQLVPKARLNLEAKLNEVAVEESAHNYSFEFKELEGNDDVDQGFESFVSAHQAHHSRVQQGAGNPSSAAVAQKPVQIIHPVRHLALAGTSNTFCDSGLGTPSSLIGAGSDGLSGQQGGRSGSSNSSSSNSFIGNSLSKWKSSMSGKTSTSFLLD